MSKLRYNERSWAIDLISLINQKAPDLRGPVCRAGGEHTLSGKGERLFPDVLLFGANSSIAMGWELKMPDTPITDTDFIGNAEKKADLLRTNGFLLWNVNTAVLYRRESSGFSPAQTWTLEGEPSTRKTTEGDRSRWEDLLANILDDINHYLSSGKITPPSLPLSIGEGVFPKLVMQQASALASGLEACARKDGTFRAQANLYWKEAKAEHPNEDQWALLARTTLVAWCNRFLFAHLLKKTLVGMQPHLARMGGGTTPAEALSIFEDVSNQFNFWNVFQPHLADGFLSRETWQALLQLHSMFMEVDFVELGQEHLQELLECTLDHSRRKTAGQFSTPRPLARLLASMALHDLEATVHDPCCGTGSIARAAYDLKVEGGIPPKQAIAQVYASDKVAYPLQMATLALAELGHIGEVCRIFKRGCEDLAPGRDVEFKDPNTGAPVCIHYDGVDCFISNFPFVRQEDIDTLNPGLRAKANGIISTQLGDGQSLPGKSDLYAYLPFILWETLSESGRLAFISSNAWMATDWGKQFRALLSQFYRIETILISGVGRWFGNADVVTSITVLSKRNVPAPAGDDEITSFAILNKPLNSLQDADLQDIADRVLVGKPSDSVSIAKKPTMQALNFNLGWNALFGNTAWLDAIGSLLVPASRLFTITRGERRGWDKMFFPHEGNPIEECYLKPVLKNLRMTKTYCATPNAKAFCCGESIEELENLAHRGAIQWIRTFEHSFNTKNKPLPEALARAGCHWYEMKPDSMADLVAQINYGDRLFVAKLDVPSFVNQRLIPLCKNNDGLDIELAHALLNSIVGLFFLEALGFGRGLGALDLSTARLREGLRILNPDALSPQEAEQIKEAFRPVAQREVLPLAEELSRPDRRDFDQTVLDAYGIGQHHREIENSLNMLHAIRCMPREQEQLF